MSVDAARLRVLDTTILVEAPAAVLARLTGSFGAFLAPGIDPPHHRLTVQPDDGGFTLTVDGVPALTGAWVPVLGELARQLNQLAVHDYAGFAVHAGVVALDGRAVGFPAVSGSGKSTMTAACLRVGFDYLSDEALCVSFETGLVEPYPKPLTLSAWSCVALGVADAGERCGGERLVTAADLGAGWLTDAVPLADVVLLERADVEPELTPLSRADVVPALLDLSFNHFKRPAASVELVAELARGSRAWRLRGGDPLAAARLLQRALTDG